MVRFIIHIYHMVNFELTMGEHVLLLLLSLQVVALALFLLVWVERA